MIRWTFRFLVAKKTVKLVKLHFSWVGGILSALISASDFIRLCMMQCTLIVLQEFFHLDRKRPKVTRAAGSISKIISELKIFHLIRQRALEGGESQVQGDPALN